MKKQPFCTFLIAGLSITDYGLLIPSPFVSLEIINSQLTSTTSWILTCVVGGDSSKRVNSSAFEALLYSAAQAADGYSNSTGIPVSFMFGWMSEDGQVSDYTSYQGFSIQFKVTADGRYLRYELSGLASLAFQSSVPTLRIPALTGIVQPSAVLEALAKAVKATSYYTLDIDHNDSPTLISHGALTTSFNRYVRGIYSTEDDYDSFPGLLKLSKSYSGSRDAAGLKYGIHKLSQVMNNCNPSQVSNYLKPSLTDETPQSSSFSYWVDEPTMTQLGTIHYKSNASLLNTRLSDTLEYGTSNTNVLSVSGSYNGVAYNMTNMKFSQIGFSLDGSGNSTMDPGQLVNSWSSSLADVYQTVNIINDINAMASQFSGEFTVTVPGRAKTYKLAQPISLIVLSGNTLSPISGIYSIMSISHSISNIYVTTLKLQRLVTSSANDVATAQRLFVQGTAQGQMNGYTQTSNVVSPYKVDFGTMYPTFEHMDTTVR